MINLEPKANPFKTVLVWEEMPQAGGPSRICIVAQSRQIVRMKKKWKKEQKKNWLSCHALEKFELSLNENQESQVKKNVLRKWWKNA